MIILSSITENWDLKSSALLPGPKSVEVHAVTHRLTTFCTEV